MVIEISMRILVGVWYIIVMIMPRYFHMPLGKLLGRIFLMVPVRKRKIAIKNISLCFPHETKAQHEALLVENAVMVGRAFFDMGIAWFWSGRCIQSYLPYRIDGLSNLQNRVDGRGVLLLFKHSLHFMLDARVLSLHHEIYGVTRDVKNSTYINDLYMQKRLHVCKEIVRPNEPLKMVRWLKQGKTLCYAMDHDYGLESSVVIKFFGVPAATIKAPYKIWKMTQCHIFVLDSFYEDNGTLVLQINAHKPEAQSEKIFLQALNEVTAAQIRENPREYYWYYSRFKSTKLYQ